MKGNSKTASCMEKGDTGTPMEQRFGIVLLFFYSCLFYHTKLLKYEGGFWFGLMDGVGQLKHPEGDMYQVNVPFLEYL